MYIEIWVFALSLLAALLVGGLIGYLCRSLPISFHQSSTKWFAISTCMPNAVGLPPSL